jgi:hypothetical protein
MCAAYAKASAPSLGPILAAARAVISRAKVDGGESGIRTHGTVSRTHAFQACSFNHSDISPSLESIVCGRSSTRLLHTPDDIEVPSSITFRFSGLKRAEDARRGNCVRPLNLSSSVTGARVADVPVVVRLCSVPRAVTQERTSPRRVLQTSTLSMDGPCSVKRVALR